MTTLESLSAQFEVWARANGHTEGDAEEALMVEERADRREWLQAFIAAWEATEALEALSSGLALPAPDGLTEDTDQGEHVTEAELSVLRAVYRMRLELSPNDAEGRADIAAAAKAPLSMVERVEALLFPRGMD